MRAGRPRSQAGHRHPARNCWKNPGTVRLSTHFNDFLSGDWENRNDVQCNSDRNLLYCASFGEVAERLKALPC